MVQVEEPAGSLCQRFEHHDAWQDGESGKVVGQILFRQRHVFRSDEALGAGALDLVNEVELHVVSTTRSRAGLPIKRHVVSVGQAVCKLGVK